MWLITSYATTMMMILMIMLLLIPMVNKHKLTDREKNSPFECGFDPVSNSRIPFSIQFFTISLMFLIFDIEITIILPLPMMLTMTKINLWIIMVNLLMIILILGLILEWKEGSMNWK
uniref:NADH-ubiquinone oxidoreductase chain 3 n=1 Tax=Allocarsidara bakeri TaxID=2218082 RepID=A0A344A233_9HEMI|nr:NADH dehydrogenase subunit 3 [Allocarsidara bakeri]AWU48824.1 NADH dehydrogenase subunit 3 [Allocarsidara bakeri]